MTLVLFQETASWSLNQSKQQQVFSQQRIRLILGLSQPAEVSKFREGVLHWELSSSNVYLTFYGLSWRPKERSESWKTAESDPATSKYQWQTPGGILS